LNGFVSVSVSVSGFWVLGSAFYILFLVVADAFIAFIMISCGVRHVPDGFSPPENPPISNG